MTEAAQARLRFKLRNLHSSISSTIAGDLSAAAVGVLISVTYALSFGALIFSGELAAARPLGFAVALTASAGLAIVTALLSSLPFAVGGPTGNVAAILAVAAGAVALELQGTPDAVVPTVLAGLALATILTGLWLIGLGTARAGQLVRFIPYPVIAGFLGASGWFIALGGVRVGTDAALDWARLGELAMPDAWPHLAATVACALGMLIVLTRVRHFLALPIAIVIAVLVHHIGFAIAGLDFEGARAAGWLVAMPDTLPIPVVSAWEASERVDWILLAAHWGDLVALMLVTAITILINVSGLEVATVRDADLDRDLRANGWAAVVTGMGGGMVGYTSINSSLALFRSGARSRFAGVAMGLLVMVVALQGATLFEMVPKTALGGLLLYLGLDMLRQWAIVSYRRLPLLDWLTVLGIIALAANFGFVMAVFAGVLAGCASFAASYSRIPAVRVRYRGDAAESNVERSQSDRQLLCEHGWQLLVMHLQGYLFFGTANSLLHQIRAELNDKRGKLRFLVLDFRAVDNIDSSAAFSFDRLRQLAAREGFTILFTSLSKRLTQRFVSVGIVLARDPRGVGPNLFDTLDYGLEWCEDRILEGVRPDAEAAEPLSELLAREFGEPTSVAVFMSHLETVRIAAGEPLVTQGEASDDLYFVESGRVTVLMTFAGGVTVRVRTMGAGTVVGEIGFYLRVARTATVIADVESVLYRLTRGALERLDRETPHVAADFHRFMARRLSARLTDKDRLLAAYVE